ncbi:glycoside hydrolase family 18 protein [Hypoxylon crocopeplum]|nr:glycoside hydrolase family 18 protein [Hypoxylon crocopeplum]
MFQQSVLAAGFLWLSGALAGYQASATDNIAIYWGQNSAGAADAGNSQKSLSDYCSDTDVDIIPIAFLSKFNPIGLDLTNMEDDKNIGQEITSCQKAGKTVLLSIGGAMFTQGPSSPQQAQSLADQVWGMFGPKGNGGGDRPFGDAVVDGFDLDIESPLQNIAPFATRLRQNIDKANGGGGQKFYLSAAPQCPYPDQNNQDILQGDGAVAFDFIMVQFYNNAKCDIRIFGSDEANSDPSKAGFNMDQWDQWAHSSKNPNTKVFLGIPGGPSAVTLSEKESYKEPETLGAIIAYSKKFSSFGGVMIWDMSQATTNPGFLDAVSNSVNGNGNGDGSGSGSGSGNTARQSSNASLQKARRTHQREWKM